ncbi:hypothetical protein LTR02_013381 [Friedmanniomyces endolithicus]|nr:hypothetical protein LTS09_006371 [Friedmanniomyces endolithicus]KAK5147752.1 hypothetical protein LTR32_000855 [Rachicladosporium monterosium]KAK0353405.1 hypothetical protein LTR94_016846 [Friedmanniomyces endolithicus]KAK0892537.1 hypothetical protein LTR02_013381 [Friedmanniomyces endolithicus]KAK0942598.1 hypothetical protein LTR29_005859 [Friedmanniomyces endolithicus]
MSVAEDWGRNGGGVGTRADFLNTSSHPTTTPERRARGTSAARQLQPTQTGIRKSSNMEADKDNANPTIINPSDLPSRRRSAPTAKRAGLFDALTPAYPSLVDASSSPEPSPSEASLSSDEETEDIDEQEVYDLISTISDPEHPLSLGSLGVVKLEDIAILPPTSPRSRISTVTVLVTPTTSACSLTTVIGLGVKVRLVNALPPRFRIDVRIKPGTSGTAGEVNKQLGDKERVAAAMENKSLLNVVNNMLATCE